MGNTNKEEDKVTNTPAEADTEENAMMKKLEEIETGLKKQLEASEAKVDAMQKKMNQQSHANNQDEIVDNVRKSAESMTLPIIDGAPIVKSKVNSILGIEGLELLAEVENAKGDKYKVPLGCDVRKLDFTKSNLKNVHKVSLENLETEKFEFLDRDPNDLAGASKVEYKKVVGEGRPVNEVDRSTGTPVATGRKVRAVVQRDVREYTIGYNGEKFILTEADLANIRI